MSEERQGYVALDDIVLLNYPCCKYPSRGTFSIAADLYQARGKRSVLEWKVVQNGHAEMEVEGGGHLEIATATVTQRECSIFLPLERLTFTSPEC